MQENKLYVSDTFDRSSIINPHELLPCLNIKLKLFNSPKTSNYEYKNSPLPLLPTNLKSLNFATWFLMIAVEFLSSAQQFSSLPALTVTTVPSPTSPNATTLKATGSVLLDRQCVGRAEHKKYGLPVRTSSPGCSACTSWMRCSVHQRSWLAG